MGIKIHSIEIESAVKRKAYLLESEDSKILIDPGAKHHFDSLLNGLKPLVDISNIDYILLQSNDFLNVSAIDLLVESGFKGMLIANESGIKYLKSSSFNNIKTIPELDYQLILNDEIELNFIPTPFLPFPECFVTYLKTEKILFSGHLFSQNIEIEDLVKSINGFHETIMPSVEFVRHSMQRIRKLNIERIMPRLGVSFLRNEEIFKAVIKYDFYNTKQVVEKKNAKNVSYNYEAICNHMIRWLSSRYDNAEILEVFDNSRISLVQYANLEIENTDLSGYKLWNYFFEQVYKIKGIIWLTILEPLVRKYNQLYNINLPAIYRSKIFSQQKEIVTLNTDNTKLEEKISNLQEKISTTTDKLLRCPLTNLYNQRFMTEHLLENISKPLDQGKLRALMAIQIDDLLEINQKYGKIKGDETIKNLVFVINRLKKTDTMLFKQNGPGVFAYIHEINEEELWKKTIAISNAIKESDVFIEPITVSIGIVLTSELNQEYGLESKVSQFVEITLMRLEKAKGKGKDQIVSHKNDVFDFTEGIILLVDEDETYQNLMVKIFDRINYKCIIAKDIYQAYEILQKHNIDIIISEINLSKLDGFQLKKRINTEKIYEEIPFIITSHHKTLNTIMRANLLDIDLVLKKPIIPEEIIGHIKRIRDRRRKLQ
jgi:diguanylate cyclase (GGDEF)-like protein